MFVYQEGDSHDVVLFKTRVGALKHAKQRTSELKIKFTLEKVSKRILNILEVDGEDIWLFATIQEQQVF